jgi:hypothetical protein
MSDEPLKKPGARPESPALDRLQAELSADLKTGEDPLYYDWTRAAEAPPSEAAYVPPMQIQTHCMDTGDLAAVIGREAAEAARHAPPPEGKVVIDDHLAVTRRMAVPKRGRSGWLWLAAAVAALTISALLMWNERARESAVTPLAARPSNEVGASPVPQAPTKVETRPAPPIVEPPASAPSRRSLPSGSPTRSRSTSPSQTPPKATGKEAVDPLFTEHPGY